MSGITDPGHPIYESGRALLATRLGEIGEQDHRNGFTTMAKDLLAGELMQVPTWVVLQLMADLRANADEVDAIPAPDSEKLLEAVRDEVINSPETTDFMAGVPLEAAHQRDRWAVSHDAGKTPFDWFWLIGYLSQKAADAAVRGDAEKAKHHTISTAAALANWHAHLTGADTRMRPGIDPAALGASL